MLAALEAGGTKMVLAVAKEENPTELIDRVSIPTRLPEETLPQMLEYLKKYPVTKMGIGSFGPLDLDPNSPKYGFITSTPKKGWKDYDLRGAFARALNIPVAIDTDVNAAALGEISYGAGRGCSDAIYITIGTGIGVGVYANGGLLHGLVHPEGGHIPVAIQEQDLKSNFKCICPYHKNCFEGMASGPSMKARWGLPAEEIPYSGSDKSQAWSLEADYIAQALATYVCAYSPQKIILGGGVMHQKELYPLVRKKLVDWLNGYVDSEMITARSDQYVVAPGLGDNAGIIGSLALAQELKDL